MSFYNDNSALNKLLELEIVNSLTKIQEKHDKLFREYKLLEKQNKDLTQYIVQADKNSEIDRLTKINSELRKECDALTQRLKSSP